MRFHSLLFTLVLAVFAQSATAETVTFNIVSKHEKVVSVKFFSMDRKNYTWPGPEKVYLLKDYDIHSYPLNCISGETICYGAWVRNRPDLYWGVGSTGNKRCSKCCYTCNGSETKNIRLNP